MNLEDLMKHIIVIPDYRQSWNIDHKLSDILLLTICAVISGARERSRKVRFSHSKSYVY